ncbi:hypothetical protein Q1695_006277 [Nippostrongylus brasiliensis]|nr:hypothetical protein Q1695_006277 [Nippostrongylus brasiliensis]
MNTTRNLPKNGVQVVNLRFIEVAVLGNGNTRAATTFAEMNAEARSTILCALNTFKEQRLNANERDADNRSPTTEELISTSTVRQP